MTVAETILVYVGGPLLVTAILAALTLRPDPKARRRRYRPGQPWQHAPVWYAPHLGHAGDTGHAVTTAAQPVGRTQAIGSSVYGEPEAGDGRHAAGASAALPSGAPLAGRGGPLGGARGTW